MASQSIEPSQPPHTFESPRSASALSGVLPTALRSRIPVLASLQRVASGTMFKRTFLQLDGVNTHEDSGRRAPSPSTDSSSGASRASTPESRDLVQTDAGTTEVLRHQAGVNWGLAEHGCRTWLAARAMVQHYDTDPAHVRALHIDAVKYMAMSLPQDMTEEESARFQRGLPLQLLGGPNPVAQQNLPVRKNSLRMGIAQITCWLMAIVVFFIPLLMTGINKALVYERHHQLTERILTNTLDLGTVLSERGAELQRSFGRFRGGQLGGAVIDGGIWIAEGLAGGIMDGVRDMQTTSRNDVVTVGRVSANQNP